METAPFKWMENVTIKKEPHVFMTKNTFFASLYHFACLHAIALIIYGFPGSTSGKNPPASTEDLRDMSSIPGLGRSSGGRHRNPLQLGWRIPWTEEPGGLQYMGSQRVGHNWRDLPCMTENILFASLYHFSSLYDIALIIQFNYIHFH